MSIFRIILIALFAFAFLPLSLEARTESNINVAIVSDQAEAVLKALSKREKGMKLLPEDWDRIFKSEGYVRLKERQESLNRPFENDAFKAFVMEDSLLKRFAELEKTLSRWKTTDSTQSAKKALAYLPTGAYITAKIYPVIKPAGNSFVFDIKKNPSIFLYLDPNISASKFENTLSHELHHIGFGTVCPSESVSESIEKLSEREQTVLKWTGAFGEGLAMLAAAGGPDIHPHEHSEPAVRARWGRDIGEFDQNLEKVESFFMGVLDGSTNGEQINKTAFSFFGVQGPWYTVGWQMAAIVEKHHGRERLIDCFCDRRKLFSAYNSAAAVHNSRSKNKLATWSQELVDSL